MKEAIDPRQARSIDEAHYLPVYARHPITLMEGEGAHVKDVEGNRYIDALAGVAVNSLGHCHPKVVEAVQDQASKLLHISNFYVSAPQAQLTRELTQLAGLERVFLSNSGAEAVEAAIKAARLYGHAQGKGGRIITFEGCFHGRSLGTIAAGKKAYQEGFEPIPQGFHQVPFNDLDAVEGALDDQTCAVMLEPVQGEGGIRVADPAFLEGLRELCDRKGLLLLFDEVQCGMGRTGSMFAHEHYGVKPDVLALAKALGGGVPIGATLYSEAVAQVFSPGKHGSTFGGNPLACSAALATLEAIEEEKLCERASRLGEKAFSRAKAWQGKYDAVRDVRGMGLMMGVELESKAKEVLGIMIEGGILGNVTGGEVLRLVPPLVIQEQDLDKVLDRMEEAIERVHGN
jgi:acetylornithine/N-succinyldiaminopimelate aminotransferase